MRDNKLCKAKTSEGLRDFSLVKVQFSRLKLVPSATKALFELQALKISEVQEDSLVKVSSYRNISPRLGNSKVKIQEYSLFCEL